MHTATLFATALLASVSSARPLVVIDPLDDRSGSWRSNMVVAAPVMLYKAPVAASAFLAVANATAPANVNVLIERGPATVYNPRSRRPDTRPGFPGRSALQASSTTSGSTQEVDAPGPSSTARTCALSSDCGGVARPVNTNAYCDQTTGTCSWSESIAHCSWSLIGRTRVSLRLTWCAFCPSGCNSKSALINGVCVARNEQVASTTAPETVPTTTTTSQVAATTTTTAPRESFTGQATYFFQNGNPGACGVWNKDSTPLVALDYRLVSCLLLLRWLRNCGVATWCKC